MKEKMGGFATSTAGHDKGMQYMILGWENGRYLLADGNLKTCEHPKKKNSRHLIIEDETDLQIAEKLRSGKPVRNEEVKRALKIRRACASASRR